MLCRRWGASALRAGAAPPQQHAFLGYRRAMWQPYRDGSSWRQQRIFGDFASGLSSSGKAASCGCSGAALGPWFASLYKDHCANCTWTLPILSGQTSRRGRGFDGAVLRCAPARRRRAMAEPGDATEPGTGRRSEVTSPEDQRAAFNTARAWFSPGRWPVRMDTRRARRAYAAAAVRLPRCSSISASSARACPTNTIRNISDASA